MVKIYYQNVDVFAGISPTPTIQRTEQMISLPERWGIIENFTLNGTITGQCLSFSEFITHQQTILNRFGRDFQEFRIEEENVTVFSRPITKVLSIDFPSNQYVGIVPFTIDLQCYPSDYWSGVVGVLDPVNEYNYAESPSDGRVTLTRTISARGYNTSSSSNNALQNAVNYVHSMTGVNNGILPLFISGVTGAPLCLKTISSQPNRLDASYQVVQEFLVDRDGEMPGILNYELQVSSGLEEGITRVNINGKVDGCLYTNITGLRNRYNNLDIFGIANSGYYTFTALTDLGTGAISSGVTEQSQIPVLSFNIEFSNDPTPDAYLDYQTSLNTDILTDISTYDFSANFKARGPLKNRYLKVSGLYDATDIMLLVGSGYSGFDLGIDLNPNPLSSGITRNTYIGEISINSSYDNSPVPPSGLKKWDYSINVEPSLNKYNVVALTGNNLLGEHGYAVYDLNYLNRASLNIRGVAELAQGITLDNGMGIVKTQINSLKDTYISGDRLALDDYQFSTGNAQKSGIINFNVNYSSEWGNFWS